MTYSLFVWLRNGAARPCWVSSGGRIYVPRSSDGLPEPSRFERHTGQYQTFPVALDTAL